MPEHVHLLISEPQQGTPSSVLQKLKLRVARRLRKRNKKKSTAQMELPFGETREAVPSFWQPRFHDFNVFTERKRVEKQNYIHENPVKRGLVNHPKDWRPEQLENLLSKSNSLGRHETEENGQTKTRVPDTGTRGTRRPKGQTNYTRSPDVD